MAEKTEFVIGTSGYSFPDWVGAFYPPGTDRKDMLDYYVQHFRAAELNFTYYRLPNPRTLGRMAEKTPTDFAFWVKANQETTHKRNRTVAGEFLAGIEPLASAGKLAGVLLQFPQSFHRTVENRGYLSAVIDDLGSVRLAVEFRHRSWEHPSTNAGLAERDVTLVIPDVPVLPDLYRASAAVTTATGYFRLHSRDAGKWYAGAAERYDYLYSAEELSAIASQWSSLPDPPQQVYAFFNNCHRGQAAANAQAFARIVREMDSGG